jgi:hypothetical protein
MILQLLGQGGISALSILAPHQQAVAAAPMVQAQPVAPSTQSAPPALRAVPPATTTTTAPPVVTSAPSLYTGYECVVTLTDPAGNVMTYSPGPATNGVCTQGTPEPYNVTTGP